MINGLRLHIIYFIDIKLSNIIHRYYCKQLAALVRDIVTCLRCSGHVQAAAVARQHCAVLGLVMCKTAEQMRGLTADNDLSYSTAQSALRLYMWGGTARGAAPRDTARVLSQHS